MKTYTLPSKKVETRFSADVVVCGGGTAGVHAAVAAANEGCSVIIIEQFGSLSGSAGNGLVTPLMHMHVNGDPQCSYITPLLNAKLDEIDGLYPDRRQFDPMAIRYASERLCLEAGVKILYYHFISDVITENGVVKGIVTVSKSGTYVIEGKEFIDCTGDGDVSVLAGATYSKGNPETGKCQPISLRYTVGGVDQKAFGEFMLEHSKQNGVTKAASFDGEKVYTAVTNTDDWVFSDLFIEAVAKGDLIPEDKAYWQVFAVPGRPDTLAFNNPEFFEDVDGTDSAHLTRAQLEGKERIYRQLRFYKKYFKGFENAYISEIAPMVGIRESRNIDTKYILTGEDLLSRKKFADYICQSNYPIDVHGVQLKCNTIAAPVNDGMPWYDIPFGSLVVKDFSNLFVAGRCVGCEFVAEASLRIQPCCRATGEAAGIGASIALGRGTSSYDVDGVEVRGIMISKGADFKEQN